MEETVTEFFVEDLDSISNVKDELSVQDLNKLDLNTLTPLTPNVRTFVLYSNREKKFSPNIYP